MSKEELEYLFEKLHISHTQYDFDCGDEENNKYLAEKAFNDVEIRNSQVYVFLTKDRKTLIGYFTLTSKSVKLKIKNTLYDQPLCLLGRMAVQKNLSGKGWGTLLISKAIKISDEVSSIMGCKGVLVETYNENLLKSKFYQNRGFEQVDKKPTKRGYKYLLLFVFRSR